jgi:hypothetical protein
MDRMMQRPSSEPTERPPMANEPDGRVLPFRRPGMQPAHRAPVIPPDLAKFEHRTDEPDDYRHRMVMNALAFVATMALVVGGIWIADVMAHMRKDQDCVLTGRVGCTPVEIPIRPR